MINPLLPFWFENRGLPTVFDQEIDYFTILSNFKNTINQTITLVNSLEAQFNSLSSEFEGIKSRLSAIEARLDEFQVQIEAYVDNRLNTIREDLEAEFDEYKAIVNAALSLMDSRINGLGVEISEAVETFQNYVDTNIANVRTILEFQINDLQRQIDELQFEYPEVYNPCSGNMADIQTTVNDLYLTAAPAYLTAGEFDELEITVDEFDALQITAHNFDYYAADLLAETEE